MSRANKAVAWCLLLIALSFWLNLAWALATDQGKESFFAGPAVVVMALTLMVDAMLALAGMCWAGYGIWKRQVTAWQACVYWPFLICVAVLSFYWTNRLTLQLFPFFGPQL